MTEASSSAPAPGAAEQATPELVAFRTGGGPTLRLVAADRRRSWMDATTDHFANRCLPLLIANQAGWFVLNSHQLRANWDGGDELSSVEVEYLSGEPPYPAISHFGHGILTWHIPFIFRTSPGWNLLVRGPANWPKDGAVALEGIVESDWSVATFTMNWKLTAAGRPVMFDVDEPVCMLVPQRRGELEAIGPEIRELGADPELERGFRAWSSSRAAFNQDLTVPDSPARRRKWEKHYVQGTTPGGEGASAHQRKLTLREFAEHSAGEGARPADAGAWNQAGPARMVRDSYPRKVDALAVSDTDDGLVVYDQAHEMVHHLNASASMIFDLCDGTRGAEAIAQILADEYSLAAPPHDETLAGLAELSDRKLISFEAPDNTAS